MTYRSSRCEGTLALLLCLSTVLSCGVDRHARQEKPQASSAQLASTPASSRPEARSWPGVPYLEVRAYYSSEPFALSFTQAGVPDTVTDKTGVLLSQEQERRLISAVTAHLQPYVSFGCWFPRHAFVFYDPLGKPVSEIDVCFHCMVVNGGPSESPDLGELAELVGDLGLPLGLEGVSAEQYRKAFYQSVKDHPLPGG